VTAETIERARRACRDAAAQLSSAGVDHEALAEYIPPKRALLRMRPATMRNLGVVWRLGPLLISDSGSLLVAGKLTRSAERGRPSYHSISREERREIAATALRSGYAAGTAVNYAAVPILLDQITDTAGEATAACKATAASPIMFTAGEFRVRWNPNAAIQTSPTLEAFLAERVALLTQREQEPL
jgi:hypothetical protein